MQRTRKLGRDLRALWATLAAICLLAAGVSYAATRYLQGELEAEARRDARKLTMEVVKPVLTPADVARPIRGARYDELLSYVRERVLTGPIVAIRLWRSDGTILFSNVEDRVGAREPGMRIELHDAVAGASRSLVRGDRFRVLTSIRVDEPPRIVTAELVRSHAAIIERSRERWYPWFGRALLAAGAFAGLYFVTIVVFGLISLVGRGLERRRASKTTQTASRRAPPREEDLPAYMRPGFREEMEARRREGQEPGPGLGVSDPSTPAST